MNSTAQRLLPLVILGGLLIVAAVILFNPPEVEFQKTDFGPRISVETEPVELTDFQIDVASYGIVRPRVQSMLASQVSGQIVATSPNFDEGGYFRKGEVLLRVDARDYEADVNIARAALADARQALAEEEARAEQARIDWVRLGNEGDAPDLVLRKPQMLASRARVVSAEAGLTKARLDLERTAVRAPFDGRVLRQMVDLGQILSVNTEIAEIYSVGLAEVRLPIANSDLKYIDLPEGQAGDGATSVPATIYSDLVADDVWQASIVRTEGAIDDNARQLHVLAEIRNPFQVDGDKRAPLKIGQYVTAQIRGRTLTDVIMIPAKAIYQGSYVYVVEDGLLQRKDVDVAWSNSDDALISAGLSAGDALIVTALGQVTSGTPVSVIGNNASGRDAAVGTNTTRSAP